MEGRAASMKEGLLVELFGDADRLIDRMEALKEGFGDKFDEANRVVGGAAQHAAAALERASAGEREKWVREAQAVTRDLKKLAHVVAARSRAAMLYALAAGVAGGLAGGLAVAIVLSI